MINRTLPLLLIMCTSCHQAGSPPKKALSEDRFQSIYITLLEESQKLKTLPADTARHLNADSIFSALGTSESEFRFTVDSYRADPKNWQRFYEGVIKRLEEKQKQPAPKAGP